MLCCTSKRRRLHCNSQFDRGFWLFEYIIRNGVFFAAPVMYGNHIFQLKCWHNTLLYKRFRMAQFFASSTSHLDDIVCERLHVVFLDANPLFSKTKSKSTSKTSMLPKATFLTTARCSSTPTSSSFYNLNRDTLRPSVASSPFLKSIPSSRLLCSPFTEISTKAEKNTCCSLCSSPSSHLSSRQPLNLVLFSEPTPLYLE